jgi:hypothetical protein
MRPDPVARPRENAQPAPEAAPCPSFPRSRPSSAICGPRIVGAEIAARALVLGADPAHPRGLRSRRPSRPADRGGRPAGEAARRRAVRRRGADDPPQDDRPALRGPAEHPRTRTCASSSSLGRRPRAALPRHPQVRPGRALRRDPSPGELVTSRAGPRSSRPSGRSRSTRPSRCASSAPAAGRKGRLKPLLLDQAFIAGIGNIYADEALWARAAPPAASAPRCARPMSGGCTEAIRSILAEAVERRGSSIDDYTAPDGDGEMQERLQVYQRTGEPCPRCGRPIRRIVIGARSHPLLLVVPAPAGGRPAGRAKASCGPGRPAPRRGRGRWTEIWRGGEPRPDARRSGAAASGEGRTANARSGRDGGGRGRPRAARATQRGRADAILRLRASPARSAPS